MHEVDEVVIDRQRGAWLKVIALILNAQNGTDDNTPDEGANEAQIHALVTALNGGVPIKPRQPT